MGNKNSKKEYEEQISNSSVLELSLESKKEINIDSININNNSEIINELKEEVNLPIENEYIESSKFVSENNEEKFEKNFFFQKNKNNSLDSLDENIFYIKRSKTTFGSKKKIRKTPKPHPKESKEFISPLKLSIRSYGNLQKWNKRPNMVLYNFQKDIIDCKSCNEEDILEDYFLYNSETERTTPNEEDIQDLLFCRKKMFSFRNSINERMYKEYENILNSDYIFDENKETNIFNFQQKKSSFWIKHIKQQQLREKISLVHTKRIVSEPLIDINSFAYNEDKKKENHGLFILGILESAANERKKRNTVNA